MAAGADPPEEIVRRAWSAFEARDFNAFFAAAADDVVLWPHLSPVPLRGREEIEAYWRGQLETGTLVISRHHHLHREGPETVLAEGTLRVRSPDGSLADRHARWRFTVRDGRILRAEAVRE